MSVSLTNCVVCSTRKMNLYTVVKKNLDTCTRILRAVPNFEVDNFHRLANDLRFVGSLQKM